MTGSTSSKSLAEQNRSNFEAINTNYAKISKTPPPQDDISITIFISNDRLSALKIIFVTNFRSTLFFATVFWYGMN